LSPFGRFRGNVYAVQLRLIGKFVADFLFVLTELNFSLGVTAEALRTNINWQSAFLKKWVSFDQISSKKGHLPPTIFAPMDRPMNVL